MILQNQDIYKLTGINHILKAIDSTDNKRYLLNIGHSCQTSAKKFIKPGKAQELYVTLENTGNTNFEDLKITAFIDTLGIWKKTRKFDLKKGEKTKRIEFDIPYYAPKGRHYMRIVVSNDHIRRVIYRDFDVI